MKPFDRFDVLIIPVNRKVYNKKNICGICEMVTHMFSCVPKFVWFLSKHASVLIASL
jgi:hypothetical protein